MKDIHRLSLIAVIVLCAVSFSASAQVPTGYRLTLVNKRIIGDPGNENDEFEVHDINAQGHLAGHRIGGVSGAFIWRNGKFQDISAPIPDSFSWAYGINDWSEVAIDTESTSSSPSSLGFFWRGGRHTPITAVPGEKELHVIHLNNRRQVVVRSVHGQPGQLLHQHFLWRRGQLTRLEDLPGQGTVPQRINDQGVVVGTANEGGGVSTPVLWQDGAIMPLGLPEGATRASGRDINDHGTVLVNASGTQRDAVYLWEDGQYTALPVLPGGNGTVSFSINNSSVVVGFTDVPAEFGNRATLWHGQRAVDLNTLVHTNDPLKPYVRLKSAHLVNDRGEIVVVGEDSRDFDPVTGISAISHYLMRPVD